MIEGYADYESSRNYAPKSIGTYLILLGCICQYALRHNLVASNPVASVELPPKVRNTDIRYLSVAEIDRLRMSVPNDARGPTDRALYLTAALTGLCRGELIALR